MIHKVACPVEKIGTGYLTWERHCASLIICTCTTCTTCTAVEGLICSSPVINNHYMDFLVVLIAGTSLSFSDADSDGIPDTYDNCPDLLNADQADTDNDTIGMVIMNMSC